MKIFISQPMSGYTSEQVLTERNIACDKLKAKFPNAKILETTFFTNLTVPVQILAQSIIRLGDADLVAFLPRWMDARGCRIEELIAIEYGINRLYLRSDNDDMLLLNGRNSRM